MTTQAELVASAELTAALPILKETSLQIADPQVRYMGTLGGNIANGDPGNDMPAVMMALDATYRVAGATGARNLKARDFYLGPFMTTLGPGEIVTAIEIPIPSDRHGYAYEKLKRKIGDYATAAAAVIMTVAGGKIASCSVALTNLAPVPVNVPDAGIAVLGTSLEKSDLAAAVRAAGAQMTPSTDPRGSAKFRASVGGIMVGRALAKAFERASA
jgi:carbon-monoxide dehydrogenase medium subunit